MVISDIPIFPTEANPNIGWLKSQFLLVGNLLIRTWNYSSNDIHDMKVSNKLPVIEMQVLIPTSQVYKDINELTGYKVTTSLVIELPFETSREIAVWDALAQSLMIFSMGDELEGFESFVMIYRSNTPDGVNPQRLTGKKSQHVFY